MPDEIFYFRESDIPPTVGDIAPEVFAPLRLGLKNGLLVEIVYQGAYGDSAKRTILPEVIFRSAETWYVSAYCHLKEAPRTFRLDGISEAVLTGVADAPHGVAQDIRDHGIPWKRAQDKTEESTPPQSGGRGLWTKLEIAEGENGPEIRVTGNAGEAPSMDGWHLGCELIRCAEHGDVEGIKEALAAGADVNFQAGSGEIPLVTAARRCRVDVLKFLVERGADPRQKTPCGSSALHEAARGGDIEVVRYLVEELQLDVNDRNCFGWTPLYLAAMDGYPELMRYFMGRGADVNAKDRDGESCLMVAVETPFASRATSLEMAKLLLGAGAEVDLKDKSGWTALFYAVGANDAKCVELLLDAGASIIHHDKKGASPLLLALRNFKKRSDRMAREYPGKKVDRRLFAKVVHLLVSRGANLNAPDKKGITPLMLASGDVLKYLLAAGAYAGAYDCDGKTVAMHHIEDTRALRLLRKYGADLAVRDRHGNDLVLMAPMKCKVIKSLVEDLGLPLDTRNNEGDTILHRACEKSDFSVVKFLIRHGADPDAENNAGKTPEDVVQTRLSEEDDYDNGEDYEIVEYFSRLRWLRRLRERNGKR